MSPLEANIVKRNHGGATISAMHNNQIMGTLGGLSKYRNNMQNIPANSPDWSQVESPKTVVVGAMMKMLGNEEK